MDMLLDRRTLPTTLPNATPTERSRGARTRGAGGEIDQSLRLLRNTNQMIALFRLVFNGVDAETGEWLANAEFGEDAIVEPLPDGSIALLILQCGDGQTETAVAVARRLRRALRFYGLASGSYVELFGVRRCAATVCDADELLAELSCGESWLVHGTQA